jgi:DNA-binding NarL/FixJ family response regulator
MSGILITDDHPLFMEGLATLLQKQQPALKIYQALHLDAAKTYIKRDAAIMLMLLDRTLPGVDSLEHLPALWALNPNLRIAIISASDSRQHIKEAMDAGATGFIPKTSSPDAIITAILHIMNGGIYIPTEIWNSSSQDKKSKFSLSPRQMDVLVLAAEGHTNKQIAHSLELTEGTVKLHFNAIFKTLGADNRTHAIQRARMQGMLR